MGRVAGKLGRRLAVRGERWMGRVAGKLGRRLAVRGTAWMGRVAGKLGRRLAVRGERWMGRVAGKLGRRLAVRGTAWMGRVAASSLPAECGGQWRQGRGRGQHDLHLGDSGQPCDSNSCVIDFLQHHATRRMRFRARSPCHAASAAPTLADGRPSGKANQQKDGEIHCDHHLYSTGERAWQRQSIRKMCGRLSVHEGCRVPAHRLDEHVASE